LATDVDGRTYKASKPVLTSTELKSPYAIPVTILLHSFTGGQPSTPLFKFDKAFLLIFEIELA